TDRVDGAAHQASPRTAQDHHRVFVLVPFECRVPARGNLEIAQFAIQPFAPEQRLARDVPEGRAAFGLVGEPLDLFPFEAGEHAPQVRSAHVRLPAAATRSTKSWAADSRSGASSSAPPISSITSRP